MTTFTSEEYDVLRRARDRISDPARWTHGSLARDKRHAFADPVSSSACCWCAVGAIIREYPSENSVVKHENGEYLALQIGNHKEDLIKLNDENGHAAVLAAFDRLLATAPPRAP